MSCKYDSFRAAHKPQKPSFDDLIGSFDAKRAATNIQYFIMWFLQIMTTEIDKNSQPLNDEMQKATGSNEAVFTAITTAIDDYKNGKMNQQATAYRLAAYFYATTAKAMKMQQSQNRPQTYETFDALSVIRGLVEANDPNDLTGAAKTLEMIRAYLKFSAPATPEPTTSDEATQRA